ncbi:MAG: hypothetical protein ACJ8DZ_09240, partial [Allosphingosinicella sp.]
MKAFGGTLLGLGVVLVIVALNLTTTVSTEIPSSYLSGINIPSTVMNIGLLQRQMMWLHIGLTSFIAGSVLLAAGILADVVRPPLSTPSGSSESGPATPLTDTAPDDAGGDALEGPPAQPEAPEVAATSGDEALYYAG